MKTAKPSLYPLSVDNPAGCHGGCRQGRACTCVPDIRYDEEDQSDGLSNVLVFSVLIALAFAAVGLTVLTLGAIF